MGGGRQYAGIVEIYEELDYASSIHRKLGCPVLEVSELSIEEISLRIVRLIENRRAGVKV
jgi:regulator of PEP synthase PpsR (kinase-PPPase family)